MSIVEVTTVDANMLNKRRTRVKRGLSTAVTICYGYYLTMLGGRNGSINIVLK